MERFGVYTLINKEDLVVLLQYPGLEASNLVIVAPLVDASTIAEIPILTPKVSFEGQDVLVMITRLAAIPLTQINKYRGALEDFDYAFQRAHQRLFFGN